MAKYIEKPEIVKELEKLFDEYPEELGGLIQANVEPVDYPSDIEEALKKAKPGDTLFIFDDGNEKWLIPARSEKSALEHVRALVKKISGANKSLFKQKFILMLVDNGHGGPAWGSGDGKPKEVEADSIEALQDSLDNECKPFKVTDGVWLLQAPPEIYVAVQRKEV